MNIVNRLYTILEHEILKNIVTFLKIKQLHDIPVDDWEVQAFARLRLLEKENIKTLTKYSKEIDIAVKELVASLGKEIDKDIIKDLQRGFDMVKGDKESKKIIKQIQNDVATHFEHLNRGIIRGANDVYKDIVIKTQLESVITAEGLDAVAKRIAKQWALKGIPTLSDRRGRKWSVEAYTNLLTRTAEKNLTTSLANARWDANGQDLVRVSRHAGSRPSHYEFQGKIYSRSGMSKKYPPLSSTTYGEIDGIITGINCRHYLYAYFEGREDKHQLQTFEDNKKTYEESQRQRTIEREIRKAKSNLAITEIMGTDEEIEKAKSLVKRRQAKMRNFIKETGRKRYYTNEQLY